MTFDITGRVVRWPDRSDMSLDSLSSASVGAAMANERVDLGAYRQSEKEQLRRDDLLRLLPGSGGLLLEVGSRDGYHSKILAERFDLVVAIDLEPVRIAASKVVFARTSVTSLPFHDRTFDCVLCAEVLEHVPDLRTAAAEVRRSISSGYSRRQALVPQLRQN
jgi:2-polyprenyl-3-methyl-5-hydroxy-6-metoxy-1,4-benzoquinol methylase